MHAVAEVFVDVDATLNLGRGLALCLKYKYRVSRLKEIKLQNYNRLGHEPSTQCPNKKK